MLASFFIALIGCLLTGVQSFLIYSQGEGVCFNDGCKIVDSLTLIDPLIFNLAGFLFFLITALGLSRARKGSDLWRRFISLALLAALAVEGVLLAFQIIISQALCSYCLIILALVVLINLFMGPKQVFKGLVIFSAVLVVSVSFDYHGGSVQPQSLDRGTMARYQPEDSNKQIYLIISSTCKHCRSVLASLEKSSVCAVNFNPVDRYDSFSFTDAEMIPQYRPEINLNFLKTLGIKEIPVLLYKEEASMSLIRGEQAIEEFIDQQCRPAQPSVGLQSSEQVSSTYQLPLPPEDDGCSVEENCEDLDTRTSRSIQ